MSITTKRQSADPTSQEDNCTPLSTVFRLLSRQGRQYSEARCTMILDDFLPLQLGQKRLTVHEDNPLSRSRRASTEGPRGRLGGRSRQALRLHSGQAFRSTPFLQVLPQRLLPGLEVVQAQPAQVRVVQDGIGGADGAGTVGSAGRLGEQQADA